MIPYLQNVIFLLFCRAHCPLQRLHIPTSVLPFVPSTLPPIGYCLTDASPRM
ncbi:hypothetical protein BDV39DRAFT_177335 [Aspergillus sergii]|uniref:Uncharacterized protein n=1 Tax=Aspergillus sergii TaxID=1034303 RepID=A0A5N6X069_9EURO|nr:hypothetical protein BDV39DRAFT_177335 [Aspergillus sergii]